MVARTTRRDKTSRRGDISTCDRDRSASDDDYGASRHVNPTSPSQQHVFGDKSSNSLFETGNFVSSIYQEVLFRKKNDSGFDYLTKRGKVSNLKKYDGGSTNCVRQLLSTRDHVSKLR